MDQQVLRKLENQSHKNCDGDRNGFVSIVVVGDVIVVTLFIVAVITALTTDVY